MGCMLTNIAILHTNSAIESLTELWVHKSVMFLLILYFRTKRQAHATSSWQEDWVKTEEVR